MVMKIISQILTVQMNMPSRWPRSVFASFDRALWSRCLLAWVCCPYSPIRLDDEKTQQVALATQSIGIPISIRRPVASEMLLRHPRQSKTDPPPTANHHHLKIRGPNIAWGRKLHWITPSNSTRSWGCPTSFRFRNSSRTADWGNPSTCSEPITMSWHAERSSREVVGVGVRA